MNEKKGSSSRAWLILMILSVLFMCWTIFAFLNGNTILENGLKQWAGSSFDLGNVEERALGFMNMAMIKPLWEEFWIGIIGIFGALGLKQRKRFAWILGMIWGVMMLTNGVIQGVYEVVILNWSSACPQTYIFLVFGIIALISLLVKRKEFTLNET